MMVWRMNFTPDMTFLQMAWPTLLTGPFMVMFFVPVTGLAMASVPQDDQANAAGLSNFMRTLAHGAFATSIWSQTGWSNAFRATNQTELARACCTSARPIVSSGMHTPAAARRDQVDGAAERPGRGAERHAGHPQHVRRDRDLPVFRRDLDLAGAQADRTDRHERRPLEGRCEMRADQRFERQSGTRRASRCRGLHVSDQRHLPRSA